MLAHWRDDLDARAEAGRRLVLIGLWHLPDRRICEILRAGFPCWSTDPGSSLEGKVYVVPEVVAEQLVADRLGVTWFGPAGERPDVLAEVVAGLWRTLDAEEAYLVAQRLIES